ncbi:hypothetical protein BFV96_4763 [Alteromonas macleodii]|nr:hypothetical protein BFV96_4763 [Alteromonas macleodii]
MVRTSLKPKGRTRKRQAVCEVNGVVTLLTVWKVRKSGLARRVSRAVLP